MRGRAALALFLLCTGVTSIRILNVDVPAHAAEGREVTLGCQFDMERDVLCSIKWYKDDREFFRYVPKNKQPFSYFTTPGVLVDLPHSTRNIVKLVHLTRESTGDYRCEVSGEAPKFMTVSRNKPMEVQLLPDDPPMLTGLKNQYNVGDRVAVNCTSLPSRPDAQLTWLVNDRQVPGHYVQGPWYRVMADYGTQAILQLKFIVDSGHLRSGRIELKCVATIPPSYQQEAVHLSKAQNNSYVIRDPPHVPDTAITYSDQHTFPVQSTSRPVTTTGQNTHKNEADHAAIIQQSLLMVLTGLLIMQY